MASNLDLAKQVYDAMSKGDAGTFLGMMDEKIAWREPASLPFEDQDSPQGVGDGVLGPVMTAFPDFNMTVDEFHDAGDAVFVIGTYHGTGAETNKTLNADFVHVWRFGSGKITGFRTYTDTHDWLQAMGKA